jgi:hypothetical protein
MASRLTSEPRPPAIPPTLSNCVYQLRRKSIQLREVLRILRVLKPTINLAPRDERQTKRTAEPEPDCALVSSNEKRL